jgi:RNA polymerase sigma-70 factor (ECF subfamily)
MLLKTNTVLLAGLCDPQNHEVWREFDERYRPVVASFARRLGLSPADAEEVAQETLVRFVEEYRAGRYERERGRLRSWVFGMARARASDFKRAIERRHEARGESALAQLASDAELEQLFDEEWQRVLLRNALDELRQGTRTDPQSIRALEMLALEQRPAVEVGAALGMTANAVYAAKHRALVRLREILARFDRDW